MVSRVSISLGTTKPTDPHVYGFIWNDHRLLYCEIVKQYRVHDSNRIFKTVSVLELELLFLSVSQPLCCRLFIFFYTVDRLWYKIESYFWADCIPRIHFLISHLQTQAIDRVDVVLDWSVHSLVAVDF